MSTVLSSKETHSFSFPLCQNSVPALENNIHVWWLFHPAATTPGAGEQQAGWWDWLSVDELDRANRFQFSHHAEEWVANRARLRMLLGHYLQQDSARIEFTYDPAGKPCVANNDAGLQFNLSHTEGLAVVAVAQGSRVGVDVERSDANCDAMDLARFAFSPGEVACLCALPGVCEQQAAFLRLWTCKEAFLKGLGDGLSRSMSDFSVAFAQQGPILSECSWDPSCRDRWQLSSLRAPHGYIASLAIESSKHRSIKTYSWGPQSDI